MKNEHLLKILMEFGLTENEALVYLSALSLGATSVSRISSLSGIKRTSIYPIISKLQKIGLMSKVILGLKTFYVSEPPEKLEVLLEDRKNKFKKFLPDFSKLYNLEGKTDLIRKYEGLQSVKNIYEDLIKKIQPNEDYLIITDQEKWLGSDDKFFKNFIEKRSKLRIRIRALMLNNPTGRWWKEYERNFNMKIKLLPDNISEIPTNVVITPQALVIHQILPPIMALVIENKSAIAFQKQMFEIIWESLQNQSNN